MNLRDWKLRLRALFAPRRAEEELDEELASHIDYETAKLVAGGLSKSEARRTALLRFGSVVLAAEECRDARGTAFIDSTRRDISYAMRTFRRAPLAAATIVGTVAIGLGMIAVAFAFYSALFLRPDAVRNPSELFTLRRPASPGSGAWMPFHPTDLEALRRETSVFSEAAGILLDSVGPRIDGRTTDAVFVTGNFFQVLGVGAAAGRTLLPEDDARFAGRPVVVLSYRGWQRLLAGDRGAVGRHLAINGVPFEVIGIMPDNFRGMRILADYWVPLSMLGRIRPASLGKEDAAGIDVVGRLRPGGTADAATAALTAWVVAKPEFLQSGRSPKTAMLIPAARLSVEVLDGLRKFAPIFVAFGLILLISCANVANLLLARGVSRQREIGIRLSLGASRARIVRQLLTESLILAILAAVAGLAIARLALEGVMRVAATTAGAAFSETFRFDVPSTDWRVLLFLLVGAVFATMAFGLAPALQATRLELVRTMRGEITRDARPRRSRSVLIAVQVGASALLLIAAAVFLRSAATAAKANAGVRTSDTVMVDITNEALRPALIQAVESDPVVAAVAASSPNPLGLPGAADVEPPAGGKSGTITLAYQFVTPEYFEVLDIGLVAGRAFTSSERQPEAGVVVVSEFAAKRLWPDQQAVGQVIRMKSGQAPGSFRQRSPGFTAGVFTVVGVVRNVTDERPTFGFASFERGGIYVPASADRGGMSLTLRVRGDSIEARRALIDRLTKVDPAIGAITALRTVAGMGAFVLEAVSAIAAVLGVLALALTLSGIFSVLSYIVEQRRKEIGVRMALGATARHVIASVLSDSARPVAAGLFIGVGLAGAVAAALMSTAAAATIEQAVQVRDPLAYVAGVTVVVAASLLAGLIPAMRAARIDPMAALKQD